MAKGNTQADGMGQTVDVSGSEIDDERRLSRTSALFMAIIVLYLLAMWLVAVDVATLAFMAASMLLTGERRLWALGLFVPIYTYVLVMVFVQILGIRLPTVLPLWSQ